MTTRALAIKRSAMAPNPFEGEWATLHDSALEALLGEYAARGPQYEMLATMASGLFVQTRRMEAEYAAGKFSDVDPHGLRVYTEAIDVLRKVIDQAQRYSEAKRHEIVRTETNAAVLEVLRIVETLVDPQTFLRVIGAVKSALER